MKFWFCNFKFSGAKILFKSRMVGEELCLKSKNVLLSLFWNPKFPIALFSTFSLSSVKNNHWAEMSGFSSLCGGAPPHDYACNHFIEMRALMYACMHLWHDWHLDIETQYQIRIPTKHGSTWQYSDWTRSVICLAGIRDWYWVSISRCHGCKHPPTLLSLREVRGGSKFVAMRFSEAKWSLVKKSGLIETLFSCCNHQYITESLKPCCIWL